MKTYLIQLNHPLLINDGGAEQTNYQTIYGFFTPYSEEWNEKIEEYVLVYLGYLAAIHEWTNKNAEDYNIIIGKDGFVFVDKATGEQHTTWKDKWCSDLGNRCRQKLDLDFKLYVIELDENDYCYDCGLYGSIINCDFYLARLVREAEEKEDDREVTVVLYNRPIILPNDIMWKDGAEMNLIFGDIIEGCCFDETLLDKSDGYLAYLTMIEECYLNGKTPSGYESVVERECPVYWRKDGILYSCHSDEIYEEGAMCLQKNNQKVRAIIPNVRYGDIKYGVKDNLIVSKDLFEELLKIDRG